MTFPEDDYVGIFQAGLDGAETCSHLDAETMEILRRPSVEVLWAAWDGEGGYGPEHSMIALVKLSEPEGYAVLTEGEDATGHGCQCHADIGMYKTLDLAIRLGLGVLYRENVCPQHGRPHCSKEHDAPPKA